MKNWKLQLYKVVYEDAYQTQRKNFEENVTAKSKRGFAKYDCWNLLLIFWFARKYLCKKVELWTKEDKLTVCFRGKSFVNLNKKSGQSRIARFVNECPGEI